MSEEIGLARRRAQMAMLWHLLRMASWVLVGLVAVRGVEWPLAVLMAAGLLAVEYQSLTYLFDAGRCAGVIQLSQVLNDIRAAVKVGDDAKH